MKTLGVILIVVGLVGLLWGGLSWTQEEKVVDLGPVEVNKETSKSVPIPPIAGGIALVAGVALVAMTKR